MKRSFRGDESNLGSSVGDKRLCLEDLISNNGTPSKVLFLNPIEIIKINSFQSFLK